MADAAELQAQLEASRADAERYKNLVSKAWDDPDIGSVIRKKAKELYPELRLPEDNLAPALAPLKKANDALAEELKALREERAAEKKEREEQQKARDDASWMQKFDEAASQFSLTEDGKKAMRERMAETKNYTDPYAAAAFIVSQTPPVLPSGPMYGATDLNFVGSSTVDPNYQLLHQSPEKYLDAEIRKAWDPRTAKDYVAKEMGRTYAEIAFGG